MIQELDDIWKVLNRHEERLRNINWQKLFRRFFRRRFQNERQESSYKGLHLALCVDTRDPWKMNRVRFFSPLLHPENAPIESLDWAWPISAMGGFDHTGLTWPPPPGSTLCLMFQGGNPDAPFYIGTTWQRDKGPEGAPNWNFNIPEYDKVFKGHRKGYMVGKNDESQHLPPWNTDNYQGYDIDTSVETNLVPDAYTKTTWPHLYGFVTPEKHRFTADDGDPRCNRRWKRLEIQSSLGHYFLMKDDPYHVCGEWVNPKCKTSFTDIIPDVCIPSFTSYISVIGGISTTVFLALPYDCMQGPEFCSVIPISLDTISTTAEEAYLGLEHTCPGYSPPSTISSIPVDCLSVLYKSSPCGQGFANDGKNRYHKHKQECFPFLRNGCQLAQSGILLQSRSGAGITFDDSVEEPRGRPEWEQTLEEFDFDGCTGVFKGKTKWDSSTGHVIEMNDEEDQPRIRGRRNGINLLTASGNQVFLCDHSKPCCTAGELRGVHIRSTSGATFDMVDDTNKQCSPERAGCGKPATNARKAFVRLRSGYGLSITMSDAESQTDTDQQFLQIMAPQKSNKARGPHMLHMQERATGPGQVLLRAGGDYIVYSHDHMVEVVGDEQFPSNKLEFVSRQKIVNVKDVYYNKAKSHVFWADDHLFLLAGQDCETLGGLASSPERTPGPCVYPVVVACQAIPEYITAMTGIKASEHVFASAVRPDSSCTSQASE